MKPLYGLILFACATMSGCISFYPSPGEKKPDATIVEKGTWLQLGWYETFGI